MKNIQCTENIRLTFVAKAKIQNSIASIRFDNVCMLVCVRSNITLKKKTSVPTHYSVYMVGWLVGCKMHCEFEEFCVELVHNVNS